MIEEPLRLEGYLTVNTFEESDMVTINTNQVAVEHSPAESTSRNGLSEFAGFLVLSTAENDLGGLIETKGIQSHFRTPVTRSRSTPFPCSGYASSAGSFMSRVSGRPSRWCNQISSSPVRFEA